MYTKNIMMLHLLNFPVEVIALIFDQLSGNQLKKIRLVCKLFRDVCDKCNLKKKMIPYSKVFEGECMNTVNVLKVENIEDFLDEWHWQCKHTFMSSDCVARYLIIFCFFNCVDECNCIIKDYNSLSAETKEHLFNFYFSEECMYSSYLNRNFKLYHDLLNCFSLDAQHFFRLRKKGLLQYYLDYYSDNVKLLKKIINEQQLQKKDFLKCRVKENISIDCLKYLVQHNFLDKNYFFSWKKGIYYLDYMLFENCDHSSSFILTLKKLFDMKTIYVGYRREKGGREYWLTNIRVCALPTTKTPIEMLCPSYEKFKYLRVNCIDANHKSRSGSGGYEILTFETSNEYTETNFSYFVTTKKLLEEKVIDLYL